MLIQFALLVEKFSLHKGADSWWRLQMGIGADDNTRQKHVSWWATDGATAVAAQMRKQRSASLIILNTRKWMRIKRRDWWSCCSALEGAAWKPCAFSTWGQKHELRRQMAGFTCWSEEVPAQLRVTGCRRRPDTVCKVYSQIKKKCVGGRREENDGRKGGKRDREMSKPGVGMDIQRLGEGYWSQEEL